MDTRLLQVPEPVEVLLELRVHGALASLEHLEGRPVGVADAPTRHYVAVGVTANRRGAPSLVTSVPLSKAPDGLRARQRR